MDQRVTLRSWKNSKSNEPKLRYKNPRREKFNEGEAQMMFGFIIIIFVAYYMFNSSNAGGSCCTNDQSQVHTPLDILNDRYARSEIKREEYLERKQELSGQKQQISIKKG